MKAVICKAFGPPESLVIEDVEPLKPGKGQVVISVKACGVNFPDTLIIQGKYQSKPPFPFIPGSEVAGIVKELGEGVDNVKVGRRVIAYIGVGGFAEEIIADAPLIIPMPQAMDFSTASAFVLTYGTSHHALKDRAQLKPGETLLVLGAAGGVGIAAVELGKVIGARVVAAASTEAKLALAREHGADETVQYPAVALDKAAARALTDHFNSVCGASGAQVIFDPVGGDYTEAALRAIGWQGRYLVVGFTAGIPKLPLNLTLLKSCQIIGVFWGEFTARQPRQHAANVAALMALYLDGRIKPAVTERFPLQRGMDAIARLGARDARGKVVVMVE